MKGIYRFNANFGRMGSLCGIFIAEDVDVSASVGKHVYFGEVLGKHSDVYCDLEASDISLVTDDARAVEIFELHRLSCGTNPLECFSDDEDEEDEIEGGVV